jgi:predicted ABC-class ATPase
MSEIAEREISWLMHPYIPFGMVTNIFGDKFVGKTQLATAIISAATGSHVLHGQEMPNIPISVVWENDC